jgi:hypothetical protein
VLSERATKPRRCRLFIRRPKLTEVSYALESVSRLRVPADRGGEGRSVGLRGAQRRQREYQGKSRGWSRAPVFAEWQIREPRNISSSPNYYRPKQT